MNPAEVFHGIISCVAHLYCITLLKFSTAVDPVTKTCFYELV